jgi:hypothetical protein
MEEKQTRQLHRAKPRDLHDVVHLNAEHLPTTIFEIHAIDLMQ